MVALQSSAKDLASPVKLEQEQLASFQPPVGQMHLMPFRRRIEIAQTPQGLAFACQEAVSHDRLASLEHLPANGFK